MKIANNSSPHRAASASAPTRPAPVPVPAKPSADGLDPVKILIGLSKGAVIAPIDLKGAQGVIAPIDTRAILIGLMTGIKG